MSKETAKQAAALYGEHKRLAYNQHLAEYQLLELKKRSVGDVMSKILGYDQHSKNRSSEPTNKVRAHNLK